jgi:hypothetical protein
VGEFVVGVRVQVFHVAGIGSHVDIRRAFDRRIVPLVAIQAVDDRIISLEKSEHVIE